MASLRDALLPVVDELRGIPDQLGLRRFDVSIVVRSWSGSRPGLGANTDTTKQILVDLGQFSPKVVQVTQKDIIASGGIYNDQDLKVGPITPEFAGSAPNNAAISDFDPAGNRQEVFFKITGPGMETGGSWFKKIGTDTSKNFRYMFIVRRTAEHP